MLRHVIVGLLLVSPVFARTEPGPAGKVATLLRTELAARPGHGALTHPMLQVDSSGAVLTTVLVREEAGPVDVAAEGARVHASLGDRVECRATPEVIERLASQPWVRHIRPVYPPETCAGSVATEGDAIVRADLARRIGVDGTGVRVGALSDGVYGMEDAQASGDLPEVSLLQTAVGAEGTAMLEIIHDLAPGAKLSFATAVASELGMRNNIIALANAGCDVIVDDVSYYTEPFFEDGPIAQAVDSVYRRGVVYASSAGNAADEFYEAPFTPTHDGGRFHAWDCIAGEPSDTAMAVNVPGSGYIILVLQWDDPWGASANDYDLHVFLDPALRFEVSLGADPQTGYEDPIEFVYYANPGESEQLVYLTVELWSGEPRRLKLAAFRSNAIEYTVRAGSVFGHHTSHGTLAVAAVAAATPLEIESFSSRGPVLMGSPATETRLKPDLTATDGVSVTGAAGFPSTFYGTSASAPHVAGVAALVRSAYPEWTADEVRDVLMRTAKDMGAPGWDGVFGWGMVDAFAALGIDATDTTDVVGTITTTTWTSFGSPYRINSDVVVPEGETLTIDPGVDVLFDSDARFEVAGALHVRGTALDSVRFLPGDSPLWGGLRLVGVDSSSLAYARVSGAVAEGPRPDYLGSTLVMNGRASFSHCVFSDNRAQWGGGFYARDTASVYLSDCIIRDNVASDTGGGVRVIGCTRAVFERCEITGNSALSGTGGGAALQISDVVMTDCLVEGNSVTTDGGGIILVACDTWLSGVDISGNSAGGIGGGVRALGGTLKLVGSTLSGNVAGPFAGGLSCEDVDITAERLLIAGNSADEAGGALLADSRAEFANVTTVGSADALTVYRSDVRITSSVLLGHIGGDRALSIAHSLADSLWEGNGNITGDPMFADSASGDWSLLPGSPCVNTGEPGGLLDPDGTRGDMGAVSYDNPDAPVWGPRPDIATYALDSLTFTVSAQDPNGLPLTYWAEDIPQDAAFDVVDRRFEWVPAAPCEVRAEFSATNGSVTVFKRVTIVVSEKPVGVERERVVPESLSLRAYPNPFNPTTRIRWSMGEAGNVSAVIYNTAGQRVRSLVERRLAAGEHVVVWDGCDDADRPVGSGAYLCRIVMPDGQAIRMVTCVR